MSEIEDLAELLHSKTLEGKIPWTAQDNPGWTPKGDIRLQTLQGENYVFILKYGGFDAETIVLSVRNRNGIVLAGDEFEIGSKTFGELDEIISIVKRQSLGVDGALSDLRARLEAL